ncbi:MAG: helicase-associated domain-containing protein [Chloroflexi bacterium]|nr:helicase-associated domain-containing protein [Chloroflexota bacterium]
MTRLLRRQVTIEQMIGFLKRASREPFPKNVEVTLREWADKYGEITLRQGAILHTRDRKLMRELQHHPQLKTYIIEVLSSTVALVQADKLEELQARLQSLGYSPRVEIEPPRP